LWVHVFSVFVAVANTSSANLDDRVKNPDQMITHDIQKFSNNLAAIYANMAKPVLDVILYNYQLSQNVGAEGLVLLTVLVQLSAALRKDFALPPFWNVQGLFYMQCASSHHHLGPIPQCQLICWVLYVTHTQDWWNLLKR
jgi:hypothetical protein